MVIYPNNNCCPTLEISKTHKHITIMMRTHHSTPIRTTPPPRIQRYNNEERHHHIWSHHHPPNSVHWASTLQFSLFKLIASQMSFTRWVRVQNGENDGEIDKLWVLKGFSWRRMKVAFFFFWFGLGKDMKRGRYGYGKWRGGERDFVFTRTFSFFFSYFFSLFFSKCDTMERIVTFWCLSLLLLLG